MATDGVRGGRFRLDDTGEGHLLIVWDDGAVVTAADAAEALDAIRELSGGEPESERTQRADAVVHRPR